MRKDEVITHVLPQFFPEHWLNPPGLVYREFPSRIRVGYVVRNGGKYSYLCEKEFVEVSISLDDLYMAALTNLAGLPSAKISIGKLAGGAEAWISSAEDNFAAVRILLPKVQKLFQQEIGDEFLVTLPHRDDCFCWSPTQMADRQEKHAQDALTAFLHEEYKLTPDVLLCSGGKFKLHDQQATAELDT
jgi:uncharacterized protein YtpQ (UPF0354 family)